MIISLVDKLTGFPVKWFTDNKNLAFILRIGSKRSQLRQEILHIFNICYLRSIGIDIEWITRTENVQSDYLSKIYDDNIGTLILPALPSAPFWTLLLSVLGDSFAYFIKETMVLFTAKEYYRIGTCNTIFGREHLKFEMLNLRIEFSIWQSLYLEVLSLLPWWDTWPPPESKLPILHDSMVLFVLVFYLGENCIFVWFWYKLAKK